MRARSQSQLSRPPYLHEISKDSLPAVVSKIKPKHLAVRMKKIVSLDNIQYKEPIADKIRREKEKYIKPLTDVELIMKKFD